MILQYSFSRECSHRFHLLFLLSVIPRLGVANAYDCIGNSCSSNGRESNSVCIRLRYAVSTSQNPLEIRLNAEFSSDKDSKSDGVGASSVPMSLYCPYPKTDQVLDTTVAPRLSYFFRRRQ